MGNFFLIKKYELCARYSQRCWLLGCWVPKSAFGSILIGSCALQKKIIACLWTISGMLCQKKIRFKKLSMTQIQNSNAGLIPEN